MRVSDNRQAPREAQRHFKPATSLAIIKLLHTVVWVFFVGCIVALPIAAHAGSFGFAAILFAVVLIEVLVLAVNQGSCPLTTVATRYTADRSANFDIYLPSWLARHNKLVFGALFIAGSFYALYRWLYGSAV